MTKWLAAIALVGCIGCRNHYDAPANASDTILTRSVPSIEVDSSSIVKDSTSGLVMDLSRVRSPDHDALLKRFEPVDILMIYDAFWPIRKQSLSESDVNEFLAAHKINLQELKAILEEGDKLGWAKAKLEKEKAK